MTKEEDMSAMTGEQVERDGPLMSPPWATEPDLHSRQYAARMLADDNYPTRFERAALMAAQPDDYSAKMVGNLLAMLDVARRSESP